MNDQPSAIPWYKSPVYVATVTQIASWIVVALGLQTIYPIEVIGLWVQITFAVIGLVAGIVAERKRRNSPIQPLTLTKAGAAIAVAEASLPTIPTTEIPK